jgi:hypothetical protein
MFRSNNKLAYKNIFFNLVILVKIKDPTKSTLYCRTGSDCINLMESGSILSGVPTGRCVNVTINQTKTGVCELFAWCPVEMDLRLLYFYVYDLFFEFKTY